ncbi:hypothetical protein ACQB6R_01875 [Propionibacteriaceae bacterium G1746]
MNRSIPAISNWRALSVAAVLLLGACAASGTDAAGTPSASSASSAVTSSAPSSSAPSSSAPSSSQPTSPVPTSSSSPQVSFSDPPNEFNAQLDRRATATGAHAGTEWQGQVVAVWFKGDPGSAFRDWVAGKPYGQTIVIHADAAYTKVEMLAAMKRITDAGLFERGKPPMPESMNPDQHGRGIIMATDNYTPDAALQAELERVARMPVIIRFGKVVPLGS